MPRPDWQKLRVQADWTPQRAERALSGIAARKRRRSVTLAAAAGVVLVTLALALTRFLARPEPTVAVAPTASGSADAVSVTALAPDTALAPAPGGDGYVLFHGAARFVVPHDPHRTFRVHAGDVLVEDLGTVFTVERAADGSVVVSVDEGRVRVVDPVTTVEVGAGATHRYVAPSAASASASSAPAVASTTTPAPSSPPRIASWVPLAESGKYGEAYDALSKSGSTSVRDDAGELLLAADTARLSGHPAAAVPYLEQVLRTHASDPRAGLAAFTLGRVQLDELGNPRAAADAFARARKAGGALAEDALAREVEARSRAGDPASARALALEYEKQYPSGRRHAAVVKFGGLE